MRTGAQQRIGMAGAVGLAALAVAATLLLAAGPARSGAPGAELLPDLRMQPPAEVYLRGNRRALRLRTSTTIANVGVGPLEIAGGDAGDGCERAGRPPGRHTLQRIFEDSAEPASAGHFWRAHDLSSEERQAGCSRYHPAHDHWHFDNFARFELLSERTGRLVSRARKISFCVLDGERLAPPLQGSPEPEGGRGYYPRDPSRPQSRNCTANSTDGISVGWQDTYDASLRGQGMVVTGIRRGNYCLRLEVDPRGKGRPEGALLESNELNNVRELRVRLRPRLQRVRRLGAACRV